MNHKEKTYAFAIRLSICIAVVASSVLILVGTRNIIAYVIARIALTTSLVMLLWFVILPKVFRALISPRSTMKEFWNWLTVK